MEIARRFALAGSDINLSGERSESAAARFKHRAARRLAPGNQEPREPEEAREKQEGH